MKYVGYTVAICSMIQNVGAARKIIDHGFYLTIIESLKFSML